MADYSELELALVRWEADCYRVDLRLSEPHSDADIRPAAGPPLLARFDQNQLRALSLDSAGYGQALSVCLFSDVRLRTLFAQARANARSNDWPLRLRLLIDSSASELQALHWETLCDPEDNKPLATSERVLFTRYLASQDWRPVKLRPLSELKALVCIANPANLKDYSLEAVDVAGELQRAQTALGPIPVTALASNGAATLDNLADKLRENYDILYLVCHGALVNDEPRLWLENAQSQAQVVGGLDLVTRLNELTDPPRLIVLASCASAKMDTTTDGALTSLGPRLAESGVAAVLAMQGSISMQTVAAFMPVFFQELQRDGQIDRAVSAARGAIRAQADSWMPVLFLRLKSGRIWYVPGFGGGEAGFDKWPALFNAIRGDPEQPELGSRCIPILGDGLGERFFGSRREMATGWASQFRFPLAPYEREDLPGVSQYLAVRQSPIFPRDNLSRYLRDKLWERFGALLPPEQKNVPLAQLTALAAAQAWQKDSSEAHPVLASLPFDIYITTNPDNLLLQALTAAGKHPRLELCRWNNKIKTPSIYDKTPDYRPSVPEPLVYCLFGQLTDVNSLVLTEDDYFDFLIGVMRNKDLIPAVVRSALADRLLLFLGFQMDDWTFRVPFRYIMSQEGGDLRESYTHIAAQIDPDENHSLEPELARDYLETYFEKESFHKDVSISIYWGSVQDFVRELDTQWRKSQA